MRREDKDNGFVPEPLDDGEVEILEVVGIDEDGVAPAPSSAGEDDDARDVVVSFGRAAESPASRDGSRGAGGNRAQEHDQFVRLRADYENLRKRVDRERRDFEENANASIVGRLLPVLDNFERALKTAPSSAGGSALQEGLVLIYKHLLDELRREGLSAITALGRTFDPTQHDAVATSVGEPAMRNMVTEELQRGYLFRERVLRPALVRVSVTAEESCAVDRIREKR